jgi:hypothetical protein
MRGGTRTGRTPAGRTPAGSELSDDPPPVVRVLAASLAPDGRMG